MPLENQKVKMIDSEDLFQVPLSMPNFSTANTGIPEFNEGDLIIPVELSST